MASELSVQQIQQRLSCPICLDRYKQPKLLPCQHTFCLTPCLVNLVDRLTRRIKCPECRQLHPIPMQGIDGFPNNITIMRFLDVDLTSTRQRPKSSPAANNKCGQCAQTKSPETIVKCLDCERNICVDCKPLHLSQLKSETKQCLLNLRRVLPRLSEKVGNSEQRKTIVAQCYESIKRDVTLLIEKLIDELRNRERCLHAEAEILLQTQLRTISLEQENAEIELASVSSFCDATDLALNNLEHFSSLDCEAALMKKQCNNYHEQMQTLNDQQQQQAFEVNNMIFTTPGLNELSNCIRNLGALSNINSNRNNEFLQQQASLNNRNERQVEENNYLDLFTQLDQQQHQPTRINNIDLSSLLRITPTTPARNNNSRQLAQYLRPNVASDNYMQAVMSARGGENSNTNTNRRPVSRITRPWAGTTGAALPAATPRSSGSNDERPIWGGGGGTGSLSSRVVAPPNPSALFGTSNNNNRRPPPSPSTPPQQAATTTRRQLTNNSNNNSSSSSSNGATTPDGIHRSSTFILENNNNGIDLYNIQQQTPRRTRARTPISMTIMLDEPETTTNDDANGTTPKVKYGDKKRAKQIVGNKKGGDIKDKENKDHMIWPVSVAVNSFNNQILVADNMHRILVYDHDGKLVKSFGTHGKREGGHFDSVSGVFVDAMANIFVSDRLNHRIQVFDRYCRFVRTLGSGQGKAAGCLNFPWGIAVNKFSEVFVCDKENDRICVFHLSGRFLRAFGTHGSRPGQFDKPSFVHITKDNKVLVSDSLNHRIQIFDTEGNCLHCFGKEGTANGEFKHPRGIITDAEGFVLVADSGNSRVQVIRMDGSYVTQFGVTGTESGKFRNLEGIAIAANGDVIVCDKDNHRIQIL